MEIILDTLPLDPGSLFKNSDKFFIKPLLLSLTVRWDCWGARVRMQDLTGAGKAGKTCRTLTVEFKNVGHNTEEGFRAMAEYLHASVGDLRGAFEKISAMPFVHGKFGTPAIDVGLTAYHLTDTMGVRTYSPFASYAPLTAVPAKWTVSHVIRALWNSQCEKLTCNGRYTDDFAHDAAVNFREGEITNSRNFCRQIIESPSGWWANAGKDGKDGVNVSICCHSFDSNSFVFRLAA